MYLEPSGTPSYRLRPSNVRPSVLWFTTLPHTHPVVYTHGVLGRQSRLFTSRLWTHYGMLLPERVEVLVGATDNLPRLSNNLIPIIPIFVKTRQMLVPSGILSPLLIHRNPYDTVCDSVEKSQDCESMTRSYVGVLERIVSKSTGKVWVVTSVKPLPSNSRDGIPNTSTAFRLRPFSRLDPILVRHSSWVTN